MDDNTVIAIVCSIIAGVGTQLVMFSYTWGRASKEIDQLRETRRDHENRLRDMELRCASTHPRQG